MTKTRTKYFVGIKPDGSYHVFQHHEIPTEKDFGPAFNATIGPFKTKYGAVFMAKYGRNNPNCQCVDDAERLATLTWGPKWKKTRVWIATEPIPQTKSFKRIFLDCEGLHNRKGELVLAVHPVYDPNKFTKGLYVSTHSGTGSSLIHGVSKSTAKKVARTLFDRFRDHATCGDVWTCAGLITKDLVRWIRSCREKYTPHDSSPE